MNTQQRPPADCERGLGDSIQIPIERKCTSSPHFRTAAGFAGLQVIFTTFIGHGVTHFEDLGLSQTEIAIMLFAGPICGATFQPYFGNWSDQIRSPWGRRKPFILFGTIVLILSILTIAWADAIAHFLTNSASNETYRTVLVLIILLSTFLLWIAAQAVQVGLRALISDGCTPAEQVKASAWAGCYGNFAATLGNLSAYINDENELRKNVVLKSSGTLGSGMGSLTLLAYSTVALCMGVLLPNLVSFTKAVSISHLWIASLGLFGISMLGTFVVFSSFGSFVLFSIVGISWAASTWIPYALLGAEASHLSELSDDSERSSDYGGIASDEKAHVENRNDMSTQLGLIYGVHNLSICLPQILMCLGMGLVSLVSDRKSEEKRNKQSFDSVWILRLGGIFALLAMYIATRVEEPFQRGLSVEYKELNQDDEG
ncbi:hypothetical protein G7Y89_g14880 [Cudoniella acicularis]|uniref:Sucrose transporter n=1 Tax=Cudoniella acicularis TaxID=354080 RepID=A0A8H4QVZ1_9HELO|nr:hypothetical protein G7Y89_g14880 [Cudoniella acicularis]